MSARIALRPDLRGPLAGSEIGFRLGTAPQLTSAPVSLADGLSDEQTLIEAGCKLAPTIRGSHLQITDVLEASLFVETSKA